MGLRPSKFPRTALLPLRVALVGAERDWMGAYCRRVMSLNFAEDCEIDSHEATTAWTMPWSIALESAHERINAPWRPALRSRSTQPRGARPLADARLRR